MRFSLQVKTVDTILDKLGSDAFKPVKSLNAAFLDSLMMGDCTSS